MDIVHPGSIVCVKGTGALGFLCRNLISPSSNVLHMLIVREYIPKYKDWEFIESNFSGFVPKGMQHGLLFERYGGVDVEIYAVPDDVCSPADQALAPLGLLPCGDDTYDLFFYLAMVRQLPAIIVRMLKNGHCLRRLRPEDFVFHPDKMPVAICTRAVWLAYMSVGLPIIPPDVPPFPNAYMEARDKGLITITYKGPLQ